MIRRTLPMGEEKQRAKKWQTKKIPLGCVSWRLPPALCDFFALCHPAIRVGAPGSFVWFWGNVYVGSAGGGGGGHHRELDEVGHCCGSHTSHQIVVEPLGIHVFELPKRQAPNPDPKPAGQ